MCSSGNAGVRVLRTSEYKEVWRFSFSSATFTSSKNTSIMKSSMFVFGLSTQPSAACFCAATTCPVIHERAGRVVSSSTFGRSSPPPPTPPHPFSRHRNGEVSQLVSNRDIFVSGVESL